MSNILMTPEELRDLKRMCNDPFVEMGMTLRPKHLECFRPKIATSTMTTQIRFEKHEHAIKWNNMHMERIRRGGHVATIALAVLAGAITPNYALGITVATGSGVIKDEARARIWYPEMSEGWSLTRYFTFRYEQYPRKHFYMQWTDVIQDETGKEQEKHDHGQCHSPVGGPSGIPEKLARDLISKTPKFCTTSFK